MSLWKPKRICFNDEMEKDFEVIRGMFRQHFGIEPSNTEVQKFLLKVFKENKHELKRMPRSHEYKII